MNVNLLSKFFFFFLSPFLGVFLIELLVRTNHELTFTWIHENFGIFIISVLIFLLLQSLIFSLVNNVYITVLCSYTLILILLLINNTKLQILDNPLLPWDLFFMNQVFDLLPVLYKNINILGIVIGMIIFSLLLFLLSKYTKFGIINWRSRAILFIVSTVLLVMIVNYPSNITNKFVQKSGTILISFDQKRNQNENGFIMGFILNMPNVMIDEPSEYSKQNINKYIEGIKERNRYTVSDKKPNIVIVMSEAFWKIDNLNISSKSLTPTVDKFQKGDLISPTFGGGTSNVEFEVLTGFSMKNLPEGSIPYQQYVASDTPSLATVLAEQNYKTVAIHTFYKYYWNRDKVYNHIGFDKFIGLDDLVEPDHYGAYVDDTLINDLILKEIKENDESTFIYAITMQNHGPFLDTRFGEQTINITDAYSPDTNQIINTYGTGINHSDEALNSLFNEIIEIDEPTIVVFFGDHLPSLGDVYTDLGYIDDMDKKTLEEELKMKQTPLVVWNNYEKDIPQLESISASFLAPKIIEWAELESPLYFQFLNEFYQAMPGYTSLVSIDGDGSLSANTPSSLNEIEEIYRMLQYDLLFGKQYSRDKLFEIKH